MDIYQEITENNQNSVNSNVWHLRRNGQANLLMSSYGNDMPVDTGEPASSFRTQLEMHHGAIMDMRVV